jgi:hypothetical protein
MNLTRIRAGRICYLTRIRRLPLVAFYSRGGLVELDVRRIDQLMTAGSLAV